MAFFSKDPTLQWEKVLCPICSSPTGKGECYRKASNIPDINKKLITPDGSLPILSAACIYRSENAWKAHINYPFSNPLMKKIKKIQGVEKIVPMTAYSFIITIAKAFEEKKVKNAAAMVFKTFIKEMSTKEKKSSNNYNNKSNLIGLKFPNGQQFLLNTDDNSEENVSQTSVLEELANDLPRVKIVLNRDAIPNNEA